MDKIAIVDYGAGNIRSVFNAVKKVSGKEAQILSSVQDICDASHVILPGVGAFDKAMHNLSAKPQILEFVKEHVKSGKPFLGVCVGMQVLASVGYENGKVPGLDFISGEVLKFPEIADLKIPHMGWNTVEILQDRVGDFDCAKFDKKDFYFVHSFYFSCKSQKDIVAKTSYNIDFPAIVAKGNIIATQFHPEKSGENGLEFYKEFLSL